MAETQIFNLGYKPRPLQAELHRQLRRFNVIVLHRRAGKTVFACAEALHKALFCPLPDPRIALIYPTKQQGKAVSWDYLCQFARKIPGVRFWESELRIDIPRQRVTATGEPELDENGDPVSDVARIQIFGSHDNQDQQLRGLRIDLAIFDEFSQQKPRTWTELVRPALSDRKGGAIWIGTPSGPDHFHDLYQYAGTQSNWFRACYPASKTGIIPADELEDARRVMDEAEFAQEYECSFTAAVRGAFYGRQLKEAREEGRITAVRWEPVAPVLVSLDLGVDDLTSAWFCQVIGTEIRLLEYDEWQGFGMIEIVKELKQKRYTIDRLLLPHDVKQTELSTGKSRVSQIESLGLDVQIVHYHRVDDGIETVRSMFPKMLFDAERCELGLERLERYQKKWNPAIGKFMDKPLHNADSDCADSLRYLCMGLDEIADGYEVRGDMLIAKRQQRTFKPRVLRSV